MHLGFLSLHFWYELRNGPRSGGVWAGGVQWLVEAAALEVGRAGGQTALNGS